MCPYYAGRIKMLSPRYTTRFCDLLKVR
ncbi:DUF4113 domain-containing protein [Klebsiella pneumoniae]